MCVHVCVYMFGVCVHVCSVCVGQGPIIGTFRARLLVWESQFRGRRLMTQFHHFTFYMKEEAWKG